MFAFVFAACDGVGVLGGLHFIGFLSFEVVVVLLGCLRHQPKRARACTKGHHVVRGTVHQRTPFSKMRRSQKGTM